VQKFYKFQDKTFLKVQVHLCAVNEKGNNNVKLTLYMFKPHVQKFSDCLKPKSEARNYRNITSQAKRESEPNIRIYALEKEAKLPTWSNFVAGFAESADLEAMKMQSASALILFKVETVDGPRMFAATYGSSFTLIETSLVESNFGLKTTINTISPNKIKNIDYKNVGARTVGRSESAKRAAAIANFAFDHESEALKSITGTSLDHDLGFSVSGGASLKISIKDLQPEQLSTVAQKAYDKYMLPTYKEHFDFIDHFEQEKDVAKIAELDNELILALAKATPPERLFATYPDQIPAQECSYFKLTAGSSNENFDDIEVANLHKFLHGNVTQLDIDTIKSDSFVTGLDDNEEAMTPRKSIYSLLGFETVFEETLYVLSDSKWYKIGADFITTLNDWSEKNITINKKEAKTWFATQSEWDYCKQYEDGELFMADLYQKSTNSLLFTKRISSATSLGNLLEQAATTANLLREDNKQAWDFLLAEINQKWPELTKQSISKDLNIVFVINTDTALPQALPVFDKIAYKKTSKIIKKLQIEVSIQPLATGLKD
jgi:uncharacterized protein (TIGR04141 family)